MKSIKLITIILIFSIIQIPNGKCASCFILSTKENIKKSDLIFIGTLVTENNDSEFSFEFAIDKILKNTKKHKTKKIKISSTNPVWACGTRVTHNERQMVFAKWSEQEKKYRILTGDNFSIDGERNKEKLKEAEQLLKFSLENKWKWNLIPIGIITIFFIGIFLKRKNKTCV